MHNDTPEPSILPTPPTPRIPRANPLVRPYAAPCDGAPYAIRTEPSPRAVPFPSGLLWDGKPLRPAAIPSCAPWDVIVFRHRGARRTGTVVEARSERVRVVVDGAVLRIPREDVLELVRAPRGAG